MPSGRLEKTLPDGRLDGEGLGRGLSIRADGLPGEAVRDISRDGAGERLPRMSGALRLSLALGAEPRSGPQSREPCGDAQQAELSTSTVRAAASVAASAADPERSVPNMVTPPSAKRECRTIWNSRWGNTLIIQYLTQRQSLRLLPYQGQHDRHRRT